MSEPYEWDDASCRGKPQKWWFPPLNSLSDVREALLKQGRAICAECPRLDQCRTWSLAQNNELQGLWAGLTPHDRMLERRNRRLGAGNRWECDVCRTVLGSSKSYATHVRACRRRMSHPAL